MYKRFFQEWTDPFYEKEYLSCDREMRKMFQLYRHDQISSDKQSESCIICPYSEIEMGEVDESDRQKDSEDIFYDNIRVPLDIYDLSVGFLLFGYLSFQAVWLHLAEYMSERFREIDDKSGDVSYELFRILEKQSIDVLFGLCVEEIDIGHECSDSQNDEDKNDAVRKGIPRHSHDQEHGPQDDGFLDPPIRLLEAVRLVSQVDIVER